MSALTCSLNALNLNDGVTYSVLPGATMGERILTFDVYRSYTGQVEQVNATEANYIPATIPLLVRGTDVNDLLTKLNALNAIISSCTVATPGTLLYNGHAYIVHASPRVGLVYDQQAQINGWAQITLTLNRLP